MLEFYLIGWFCDFRELDISLEDIDFILFVFKCILDIEVRVVEYGKSGGLFFLQKIINCGAEEQLIVDELVVGLVEVEDGFEVFVEDDGLLLVCESVLEEDDQAGLCLPRFGDAPLLWRFNLP